MTDLGPDDVARYTSGRLIADDAETLRLLSAGLAAARSFCGWHVTGVREDDEVAMDGPCSALLALPTLRLVELTKVVENDVELDVDDLYVSARGLVRKKSGAWWSGHYGAITVTMTHGFEDADDFNAAVLSLIDRQSFASGGGRPTVVGPFQWPTESVATGSAFSVVERSLLEQYRLESPA